MGQARTRDRRPVSHEVTASPSAPAPIVLPGPVGQCGRCGGDVAVRFRGDWPGRCTRCGAREDGRDPESNLE